MSKEDMRTLEKCKAMSERGEYPPLTVVFDALEGYKTLWTDHFGDTNCAE